MPKQKFTDPAFRPADEPRTDDEFARTASGPVADQPLHVEGSESVAGQADAESDEKPESAKEIVARIGDASDDELTALAEDDRKTVSEAAKAEQDKRAAAESGSGSSE